MTEIKDYVNGKRVITVREVAMAVAVIGLTVTILVSYFTQQNKFGLVKADRSEVIAVRSDMTAKVDKSEMTEFKNDMSAFKIDVKKDMDAIKSDIRRVELSLERVNTKLDYLMDKK
jgi:DNA-binding transcriptional regulator YhcF (GntR family)